MKRTVEVPQKIKEAFEAKVAECIRIAREKSGKDIPLFPVIFRQMGGRAGVCRISILEPTVLYINPDFFKNHYDEQLNDTVPHEVAHGVTHTLWPMLTPESMLVRRRKRQEIHGDDWRQVMAWFGIRNPNNTHRMNMEGVTTRKKVARPFNYVCNCGYPHTLTLRLHEKIQRDGRQRVCKKCRGKLVYERQFGKPFRPPVANSQRIPVISLPPAPKPSLPKPTHRTITKFVNGVLTNIRIPLTTEEFAI